MHTDDLLACHDSSSSTIVAVSLRAFAVLVEVVVAARRLVALKPVLVLPVAGSPRLEPTPPTWEEVLQSSLPEPPSLALLDRRADSFHEWTQELRLPYTCPAEPTLPSSVILVSYYRCFRGQLGWDGDWDFTRCVYLEAYPPELVLAS